ncbi:DUF6479 family protein [Streptomyces sp. NPDC012623]|uniref:DUF6479 family protein n=1 Tax=unclassified Streptomyces TaxID=2593676 RepID=UPI00368A1B85
MNRDTLASMYAASSGAAAFLPLVFGVVVVAVLIGAFVFGRRVRAREPSPPTPEEQPTPPAGGPVGEVTEHREPNEVPRRAERLSPHELGGPGSTRPSDPEEP